jgi:cytochrome P450
MELCGHALPAGRSVGAYVLWAHSAEAVFPEPERFLPERFLGRTYSPFEFLPFGGGNRRCIGAAFALYEMKWVLATLLGRFHFELQDQAPIRVVQRDVLLPGAPIRMIVRPATIA